MHLRILTSTVLIVLLAALIALPVASAQGGPGATPVPSPTPAVPIPAPFTGGPLAVGLPFSDTFDTPANWQPDDAWQFAREGAYEGNGWLLDGAVRGEVSTLTSQVLIDLSGALSAQLMFQQQGRLPESDLVAVDLSLDGGASWIMIDMQAGIDAPDWERHTVDLSDFRGLVVQLRLRVLTSEQTLSAEAVSVRYYLDNLTIQYALLPDPALAGGPYHGPHTLMGPHVLMNTPRAPLINFVTRMRAAGFPLGTIKGTMATEDLMNEIAQLSPETIIVFRPMFGPYGYGDCPDDSNPPVQEARTWIEGVRPYWDKVEADYYELVNECGIPIEWLVPFFVEAMRLAGEMGECVLAGSFYSGHPEIDEFSQMLPVFEYALANPCRPGWYHGISLHAYPADKTTLLSDSGIYLGLRHRLFYDEILAQLPEADRIPLYLTEAGPGDGSARFSCEDIARDVVAYTRQLEHDPYLAGWHLWTTGGGIPGFWMDVTPCLSLIADSLLAYYAAG